MSEKQTDTYKGCPTTRTYPRSLAEAFPNTVDRADWWYPPEKEPLTVTEWLLWSAGICMWVGLAYYLANN